MRINLNYPANWEDFENLCFHLWKSIWGDYASHPNGRRGQRQNGVDIYGKPPFRESYTGVQCKGKNGNYGKELTIEEIDKECENAKGFDPKLDSFIMATTSPRNAKIQKYCREINSKKTYDYELDCWSWDDIEEEVQCRPDVMEKFYPSIKNSELVNEIRISRITPSNKLHAFFSRPGLLDYLNRFAVNLLDNIAYELAINAFEHGNATYFKISIEGKRIVLKDDGGEFNPLILLETKEKRGGSTTLKYANNIFAFKYQYKNGNILELSYCDNESSREGDESYSVCLNVQDVFGRSQTQEVAYQEIVRIPGDVKHIVIDICGKMNPAISIVYGFFYILQKLIKSDQSIHVYLPHRLYYYEDLKEQFKEDARIQFIMKS